MATLTADPAALGRHRPSASFSSSVSMVDKLSCYLDELVTWNARVDLTAARSAEELVDLSLADAWVLANAGPDGQWVDVGAGAGAPGLVLAILRPSWSVTLVEPRAKRVSFLRTVAGRLGAGNVQVVRGRSETLGDGGWDAAVSRATFPPEEWVAEGARLSRRAVWVLLARGEAPALRGHLATSVEYQWPLTGAPRRAVCLVRESPA
jgi:16S rRNA (guanine527-N7)-methyltransferase